MSKKKTEKIYYGIFFFIALALGLLFELKPLGLFFVVLAYLLCVPQFLYNQKKCAYEIKRFQDINAYMSQMAQSFIYTKDVILSLQETSTCFSGGPMGKTLREVFEILEKGKGNIKLAEQEALLFIESRYDCEKLRNLHMFFLNAEELGGECHREFKILERMRLAWQSVVESIYRKRVSERNIGVMMYAFLIVVCILMLRIMRNSNLDIVGHMVTQIIDVFLIVGFVLYFVAMDNRCNKSLLVNPAIMSETKANTYFQYMENYDVKQERRKYRALSYLSLIVAVAWIYLKPNIVTVVCGMILTFVGFYLHAIIFLEVKRTLRMEIEKAFPKWLFDVMLLLQRESVEGAIEKSVETAPPVLKRDLYRITAMFAVKPHNPDAYMSFLKEFDIQNINEIMHKLYSLAVGANRDSEVLDVVMEKNIKNLEKAERDSMIFRDNFKTFTWVPFVCVGFGCTGYMVIAIMTSISGIIDRIK